MKTERRHQLEKNELADALGDQIEHVRPYIKTILTVVVAVIAVAFAITFFTRRSTAQNEVAWYGFYNATATGDPDEIEEFAEANSSTTAGRWAMLQAGEIRAHRGARAMLADRKEAQQELEIARKHFDALIQSARDPLLKQRAEFGLAGTYETLNQPEEAEPIYKELQEANPDGPIGKLAADRLTQMKRLSGEQWYAWFEKQKPSPAIDPTKLPGLDNLPERDDINKMDNVLDGIFGGKLPESTTDDKKAPVPPPVDATDDNKKADEKDPPTTDTDEKKVDDKKADEKKTDETPEPPKPDDSKADEKKADETKPAPQPDSPPPADPQPDADKP